MGGGVTSSVAFARSACVAITATTCRCGSRVRSGTYSAMYSPSRGTRTRRTRPSGVSQLKPGTAVGVPIWSTARTRTSVL